LSPVVTASLATELLTAVSDELTAARVGCAAAARG